MRALERIKEKWGQLLVRSGWWKSSGSSPVIATGTNVDILPYEDLQQIRFEAASRAAGSRLGRFDSTSPSYPPTSSDRIANQGFRKNSIARGCQDLLARSALLAKISVENIDDGSRAVGRVPDAIREFMAFPSGREENGPRGSIGPLLWRDVYERLVLDLYNYGNGMLEWVDGEMTEDPVQLWRLDPTRTYIVPHPERLIDHYVIDVDGVPVAIPVERVIHSRFWDPTSEFWGLPPLFSGLRNLTADNELTDFTQVTLQNLGVPPAIIEYDIKELREAGYSLDPHKNPADFKAMRAMRDRLWDMYGGQHRGKFGIAFGFKVRLLGLDMHKMDASGLTRVGESRIATCHGVPMVLLNRSSPEPDRPGASVRIQRELFFTDTVLGLVGRIEGILSPRIVAAFDRFSRIRYRIRFDMSGVDVLREQMLKRWREAAQVFQSGLADRVTCQEAAGIPLHGDPKEFVPLATSSLPDRMQGDQGEDVGP